MVECSGKLRQLPALGVRVDAEGRAGGEFGADVALAVVGGEQGAEPPATAARRQPIQGAGQHDSPGKHLQRLIAPRLCLLDCDPLGGIGGEERRLGHEPIQIAGDLVVALDPIRSEPQCRNGAKAVEHRAHPRRPPVDHPYRLLRAGEAAQPYELGVKAGR
jgi:hypothetical protein